MSYGYTGKILHVNLTTVKLRLKNLRNSFIGLTWEEVHGNALRPQRNSCGSGALKP